MPIIATNKGVVNPSLNNSPLTYAYASVIRLKPLGVVYPHPLEEKLKQKKKPPLQKCRFYIIEAKLGA